MEKTIDVNYKGHDFTITGDYDGGELEVWTLRNGDPGHPGLPASFQMDEILFKGIEISDLIDTIVTSAKDPAENTFWQGLEEACIEVIED